MRHRSEKHLSWIRGLPCVVCRNNTATEAAHVRLADGRVGKPITGIGIKPDDCWVVPLCHTHHAQQHEKGEIGFWFNYAIDPIIIALALWQASGDQMRGERIISRVRDLSRGVL